MTDLNMDDAKRRQILQDARVIAMVGESDDHYYTSYQVAQYLQEIGYRVYPVNPTITDVDGVKSYPSLADVPEHIDIVDVFRNSDHVPGIVVEAIEAKVGTIWLQLDVLDLNGDMLPQARAAGINTVENMCIRTEHERLFGGKHAPAR